MPHPLREVSGRFLDSGLGWAATVVDQFPAMLCIFGRNFREWTIDWRNMRQENSHQWESAMTTNKTAIAASAEMETKFTGLRRFNLIMGFLHLIQGILMIVLSNDTTYPIYTNYLNFDVAPRSLSPNPQLLYELRFGPAVAAFLLISAAAHFFLATIGYSRYVQNLKKGMNPIRFYEYALSSSLMIVLIGMLVGLWDLGAIMLIFTLNATMNLFGIMMELHNQHTKRTD